MTTDKAAEAAESREVFADKPAPHIDYTRANEPADDPVVDSEAVEPPD
jgi:hypothetical protein